MHRIDGLLALDGEETVNPCLDGLLGLVEGGIVDVGLRLRELVGKVVGDGDGKHEITVCQTLHEGGSTEAVAAVVGDNFTISSLSGAWVGAISSINIARNRLGRS